MIYQQASAATVASAQAHELIQEESQRVAEEMEEIEPSNK